LRRNLQGLLKGGIDLFVAAGLLAFQRKRPTLGEIYRIAASGGNKQKEYFARGHEVDNRAAKLIFTRLASTNNDTLTSYVSLLMTSGLDQWQNPAIDEATAVSDFDFRTIRKKPFSVYLVVQPLMVKPLAPLIRLFFSDLLSAMQEKDPGPDEPWPVMIMLDEFNRLGKMPIVVVPIPEHAFFEKPQFHCLFSHNFLQITGLTLQAGDFTGRCLTRRITSQPLLTGFHEVLRPIVIQAFCDAFTTAQLRN